MRTAVILCQKYIQIGQISWCDVVLLCYDYSQRFELTMYSSLVHQDRSHQPVSVDHSIARGHPSALVALRRTKFPSHRPHRIFSTDFPPVLGDRELRTSATGTGCAEASTAACRDRRGVKPRLVELEIAALDSVGQTSWSSSRRDCRLAPACPCLRPRPRRGGLDANTDEQPARLGRLSRETPCTGHPGEP